MLSVRWSRGVPAVFLFARARRRAAAGRACLHAVHGPPCLCTVYKCREEEARLNQYGAPSASLSFTAFLLRPPPGARREPEPRLPTAPPTRRARPPTVSARPSADRRAVPRGPSPQCRPTSQASVKHQLARLNATSKDKGQGRLMLKSLKRRSNPREDLHLIPHLPRRHSAAEAAFERPVAALALALAVSVRSYKLDAEPRGVGIQPRVAPRVDVGE